MPGRRCCVNSWAMLCTSCLQSVQPHLWRGVRCVAAVLLSPARSALHTASCTAPRCTPAPRTSHSKAATRCSGRASGSGRHPLCTPSRLPPCPPHTAPLASSPATLTLTLELVSASSRLYSTSCLLRRVYCSISSSTNTTALKALRTMASISLRKARFSSKEAALLKVQWNWVHSWRATSWKAVLQGWGVRWVEGLASVRKGSLGGGAGMAGAGCWLV